MGDRHPQFNDAQWTQAEVAKVRELVDGAHEGEVDWSEIAEKLGVQFFVALDYAYMLTV